MNLINLIIEGIPQKENHTLRVYKSILLIKMLIQMPFQIFSIVFSQVAFLSAKSLDLLYIIIQKPHHSLIIFFGLLKLLNSLFDNLSEFFRKIVDNIEFIFPKYYHHIKNQ